MKKNIKIELINKPEILDGEDRVGLVMGLRLRIIDEEGRQAEFVLDNHPGAVESAVRNIIAVASMLPDQITFTTSLDATLLKVGNDE